MTLNVGHNYIPLAGDCNTATGSGCNSIFINGNLARVLLASYKITGNMTHMNEGLRWCDTFVSLQHQGMSGDGKDTVGWWDTGYDELYLADTGTAVTALAVCHNVLVKTAPTDSRIKLYMTALMRFDRFVRKGVNKTPQCTPVLPHHATCDYDGNGTQTSNGWIHDASKPGLDAGGVGDGYYKGAINLMPYTISTALTGGVFYAEMFAVADAAQPLQQQYASITHGAVQWLLSHQFKNGTIPYIIDPPTSIPHEYQCISYSAEAFVDLWLRFGPKTVPHLHQLNATIEYLLSKQGRSGALLPNGSTGEIRRSARAASLMQWWYSVVDPRDERVARALGHYLVDWLQSDAGAKTEGVAEMALSSGFIGLAVADLIKPWCTFA